ncbi:hypothetical protein LZ198_29440 [Myxococcus sp. K15C18031901]|uniref:hypothetical protein n=1 Tax=Myxococcus dinghuensis TaxID=2906761 RepID=UPI0020A7812F|nr:hypothetical protein [Myxococcus dinghuensis]MCP3103011.1 hypothetical protein [Myxococcus dinghuensis]
MRNGIRVVGMLLVAGAVACATRVRETPAAEVAQDDPCAVGTCPGDAGTCLDLSVNADDQGKHFSPAPGKKGWTMCSGQGLALNSLVDKGLCVDLRAVQHLADGGTTLTGSIASNGNWQDLGLPSGMYCLSVCTNKDGDCSQGCKEADCSEQDEETIRGNLDVVTKVPDPHEARR